MQRFLPTRLTTAAVMRVRCAAVDEGGGVETEPSSRSPECGQRDRHGRDRECGMVGDRAWSPEAPAMEPARHTVPERGHNDDYRTIRRPCSHIPRPIVSTGAASCRPPAPSGCRRPPPAGTLAASSPWAAAQESDLSWSPISHQQLPTWTATSTRSSTRTRRAGRPRPASTSRCSIYNTMTGEIVPWLATAWEFSDGQHDAHLHHPRRRQVVGRHAVHQQGCRVHLRPPDGATRACRAPRASAASCRSSTSVEAPDDTTVVFTFNQVFTPGLYDIGEQMIVPEHIWKDVDDPVTFTNENPVGTGPFTEIGAFEPQYYEILQEPELLAGRQAGHRGLPLPALPEQRRGQPGDSSTARTTGRQLHPRHREHLRRQGPGALPLLVPGRRRDRHLYTNTTKAPFDDAERAQGDQHGDRPRPDRHGRHVRLHPSGRRHRPERRLRLLAQRQRPSPPAPSGSRWTSPRRTSCSTPPAWPGTATSASCPTARR